MSRSVTSYGQKIETAGSVGSIRVWRSLAACRALLFCDDQLRPSRIGREGETHGFGAHPGLRHGDGGPRVAGAKRITGEVNQLQELGESRAAPQGRKGVAQCGYLSGHPHAYPFYRKLRKWMTVLPRPEILPKREGSQLARLRSCLGMYQ